MHALRRRDRAQLLREIEDKRLAALSDPRREPQLQGRP